VAGGEWEVDVAAERLRVQHFGPRVGERGGGGIAAVIQTMTQPHTDGAPRPHEYRRTATGRLSRRFHSVDLWVRSLATLAMLRVVHGRRLVAHVHLAERGSLRREGSVALLARRLGVPTVATVHISQLDQVLAEDAEHFLRVLRSAHRVHALGPTHTARIAAALGPGGPPVVTIPNAVAVPEPPAAPGAQPPVVFFAGEVGTRKGVDVLLDAWPAVRSAAPDAQLVLAGLLRDLDPPPTEGVTLLGATDPGRVAELLHTCRCAVLPSRQEAMPMFLLEAMAAGVPVVATPVGDVATIVPADWLVPVEDAAALATAITRLVTDPGLAAAAGARNSQAVRDHFSVAVVHPRLDDLYDEIHAERRARRASRGLRRPRT
jgi:glycosyltransferase involved in cell wall biosynthesis